MKRNRNRGKHRRPTVEQLKGLFVVEADGRLRRIKTIGNGKAGDYAGNLSEDGYLQIEVLGYPTRVHRVVFALTHGRWPENQIDHIDGNRLNNAPSNLRDVPQAINQQNLRGAKAHNQFGLLGVSHGRQRGKFRATIVVDRKQRSLGVFATAQEAHQAYLEAKRRLHPGAVQ